MRIIGSGDAFCSGGRHQTCFHLNFREQSVIVDFGPSALAPLREFLPSLNGVDLFLITHLHGDHFGGLPFFLLDAQFASTRLRPLTIAGPKGIRKRIEDATAILFPDLLPMAWRFPLLFVELDVNTEQAFDMIKVDTFRVDHSDPSPALALRLKLECKIVAFSGDTAWTSTLTEVADGADLFLCECHSFKPNKIQHLDWQTLNRKQASLRAKRIVLTHMSQQMLDRMPALKPGRFEFAADGMEIKV